MSEWVPGHLTDLFAACEADDTERARAAIEAGASVDGLAEPACPGDVPLFIAIVYKSRAVLELLAKAGANVNIVVAGRTPISFVLAHVSKTSIAMEMVEILVKHEADINKLSRGQTPLHDVQWFSHRREVCELIISLGADLSIKNERGETPLQQAQRHCRPAYVDLLEIPVKPVRH